ncbi:hypothetical protein [Ornithinibacillus halophilus]|uniref:Uncharacterized protein n=1 Tax=Ornithinibacillus halophilus TaxID=930117 RepID=A0A1M5E7Z0_9BACI|nr:hypothetical protein [Ornithinibacillus halophilus]SHF75300.1 hypothetical protein SAMN05216225_100410 [Ornithinibacillus halophilus]
MSKEQLDRMEDAISNLTRIVGKILEEQNSMREEMTSFREEQRLMREEINSIKEEQCAMRQENNAQHEEFKEQINEIKTDMKIFWDKANNNELEIGRIKKLQGY